MTDYGLLATAIILAVFTMGFGAGRLSKARPRIVVDPFPIAMKTTVSGLSNRNSHISALPEPENT